MGAIVMCETLYPVQGKRVVIDQYGRVRARCGDAVTMPKEWEVKSLADYWSIPLGSEKGLYRNRLKWWHSLPAPIVENGQDYIFRNHDCRRVRHSLKYITRGN